MICFLLLGSDFNCKSECKVKTKETKIEEKSSKTIPYQEYYLVGTDHDLRNIKLPKESCEKYKRMLGGTCQPIK